MERHYKAFISYRHLPLDMEIAKKLHTTIEHYVIPKEYRVNGEKKLGLVFRDKDELPITNNLTENLRMALRNAEYLILVCTPETQKSVWVLEEIQYFAQVHDRDHILVMIADGLPGEVFPKELTEVYDEEGNFVRHIEPLAANIVAETKAKRNRLFQVEVLRILATLIGCPFDALYKREQRYRRRQYMAAVGVTLGIAGGFIGMLLNRNAQIQKQLLETQKKESQIMAYMSELEYDSLNYYEALQLAVDALPEDNEKPYLPSAEKALGKVLGPYVSDRYTLVSSLEQELDIANFCVSADGTFIFTRDAHQVGRMYETLTGKLLWRGEEIYGADFSASGDTITVYTLKTLEQYDSKTGEMLWSIDLNITDGENEGDFPAGGEGILISSSDGRNLKLIDETTGALLQTVTLPEEGDFLMIHTPKISADGQTLFLGVSSSDKNEMLVWNVKENTYEILGEFEEQSYGLANACFTPDGRLVVAEEIYKDEIPVYFFEKTEDGWQKIKELRIAKKYDSMKDGNKILLEGIRYLEAKGDLICLVSRRYIILLDSSTGDVTFKEMQQSPFKASYLMDDGQVAAVLGDNSISLCTKKGMTNKSGEYTVSWQDDLANAVAVGTDYKNAVFVVQTEKHMNRLSIIKWKEKADELESIPLEASENRRRVFVSPDGAEFAWIKYDTEKETLEVATVDKEHQAKSYTLSGEKWGDMLRYDISYAGDQVLLLNNQELALDEAARMDADQTQKEIFDSYELSTRIRSGYNKETNTNYYAISQLDQMAGWKTGGELLEISLNEELESFEDDLGRSRVLDVGGNGYAITEVFIDSIFAMGERHVYYAVSLETGEKIPLFETEEELHKKLTGDSFYDYSYNQGEFLKAGDTKPYAACMNLEREVNIYNLETGEIISTLEDGIYVPEVKKMIFVDEDKYLFVFEHSGRLHIYDVESGKCLQTLDYSDYNLNFDHEGQYQVRVTAGKDKIIVLYDDEDYTEGFCAVYDLKSMEECGRYNGVIAYDAENNLVAVKPYQGEFYYAPLYTREELRSMGEEILSRHQNQEEESEE